VCRPLFLPESQDEPGKVEVRPMNWPIDCFPGHSVSRNSVIEPNMAAKVLLSVLVSSLV